MSAPDRPATDAGVPPDGTDGTDGDSRSDVSVTRSDPPADDTAAGDSSDGTDGARRWVAVVTVVAMASWPFLSLMADNLDQPLDMAVVRTWWLATLAGALVVLGIAMAFGRRVGAWAGGVLGVVLWLVFSLPTVLSLRDAIGSQVDDVVWWAMVAAPIVVVATWLMRKVPMQRFVAIMAVALAGMAAVPVAADALDADAATDDVGDAQPAAQASFTTTPDVWLIELDGLGSNDFMRERTGYDPAAFEQFLADNGFDVQAEATSNYPFTNLSIASTLMMDYLFTDGVDEPPAGPFFERLQGDNLTVETMRANGYSYAHTYPGLWTGSKCSGVEDLCIGDTGSITDTETALATMSPLGELLTSRSQHEDVAISNDPAHVAAQVIAADLPDPQFTFLHVLNPHPPLLRGADCGIREVDFTFSAWGEGEEYGDAVECLHAQLQDAVDQILADDPDAVIIIQGDHGPRLGIDWTQPGGVFLDDDMHFSILSAMRLPAGCDVEAPDDMTPVNTFRIVTACLEGTEPDLLPNERFPIQAERG
ncbi:MAG TPA: sulfatase-like hydrolase/transferase [Nitriliruptoraceae bacterium]|nr:sulfatase-like hydrolase/transferase [Nitriliruptoraceae bacterium]